MSLPSALWDYGWQWVIAYMSVPLIHPPKKCHERVCRLKGRGGARGAPPPPNISKNTMPKWLHIFVFCFASTITKYIGTCNTPLERCLQDLSNNILQAPKFRKCQLVKPKKICSRLAIAQQAGQKNCNGKTTMFSTSALKESWRMFFLS